MPLKDDAIVLLDGARTPIGTFLGGLKSVTPTELGVFAARGALERSKVDPADVDSIYFGNVLQSAKDTAYIARHVGLRSGIPTETPALTVNRACASGLDAIIEGSRALRVGDATVVLAGGAENMSMMPYAMRGVREGWKMQRSDVDDMLFSALHDPEAGCSIAETVEHLAQARDIGREAADEAALISQQRAARAAKNGVFAQEIVPVDVRGRGGRSKRFEHDENLRPETTMEALSALPPLFGPQGRVTAGNSSGLNDAGAAMVLTTGKVAKERGYPVLGELCGWSAVGVA
ncbi:MAG: acetyl-CoA C-acyltransferase, partial [Myxococcota bacterium]